jgi:SAM-dependent methyltransferase
VDHAQLDLLRDDLTAARYRVEVLDDLWGAEAAAALFRGRTLPALRSLEGRVTTPLTTLARLFLLNEPVDRADLDATLPRLGTPGALALGLVSEIEGSRLTARLDLRPYSFVDSLGAGSWWIVSDLGEAALGRALDEDHVLGIGGASTTLAGLIIPTPADSVLDLGTGCGIQALHASRFARRVVATDISERALEIAALNARLNGIDSIEFRLGSLFEPVAGERFDRIVSNPPFVITPRVEGVPLYEYRDGGLVGDGIVEAVVRGAAEHLTPGGILQMLGNWEYRTPEPGGAADAAARGDVDPATGVVGEGAAGSSGPRDGLERVRAWVEGGTGLDAWVIEREQQDAPLYAETWIRDGGTLPGTARFDELYALWLDDFEARGVQAVGFGYLLLRSPRGSTPTLARYERLDSGLGANPSGLGAHLAHCLDGHDWQAHRDLEALLRSTLVYASDVTEERHYWPGHEDPVVMALLQGGGFGRREALDTGLAAFVGACDGDLAVGPIIDAIAQVLSVDAAALRAELAPRIRTLLADAFLLPA